MARILIVEDNDPVRWALATLLQSKGHQVDQAADGRQALIAVSACSFDVVLMALCMPCMDGFETCQRLRQRAKVPILIISTNRDPNIRKEALAHGADAFLPKPFKFERVLDWIRKMSSGGGSSPYISLAYLT